MSEDTLFIQLSPRARSDLITLSRLISSLYIFLLLHGGCTNYFFNTVNISMFNSPWNPYPSFERKMLREYLTSEDHPGQTFSRSSWTPKGVQFHAEGHFALSSLWGLFKVFRFKGSKVQGCRRDSNFTPRDIFPLILSSLGHIWKKVLWSQ